MKIMYDARFKKSIIGRESEVERVLTKLKQDIAYSESGIWSTYIASQTRKFQGAENLFKFRANRADRIIYTYAHCLKNNPHTDNAIYLIELVSHDDQNRKSKSISIDQLKPVKPHDASNYEYEALDDQELQQAMKVYHHVFDLEKTAAYLLDVEGPNRQIHERAVLNREQYELVNDIADMLLIGGAGSGKTVVCIHKAAALNGVYDHVGYFTYSHKLRDEAKRLYEQVIDGEDVGIFHVLEEYCMQKLNLKENNFVRFGRFNSWFQSQHNKPQIEPYNIWAEIRGLIKGYMGDHWFRPTHVPFDHFEETVNQYLRKREIFVWVDENRRHYRLNPQKAHKEACEAEVFRIKNDQTCPEVGGVLKAYEEICQQNQKVTYDHDDYLNNLIKEADYLSLDASKSVYDEAEKRKIYRIATDYQRWLQKNGLFDDNDLAGRMLETLYEGKFNDFDQIIVDEIQDLTEWQIFMLFHMVNDHGSILFAGDTHQIINPTYYRNDRFTNLYFLKKGQHQDIIRRLNKNYRSQEHIVRLANFIGKLRRDRIGKEDEKTEELEISIIEGHPPYRLAPGEENLKAAIEYIEALPTACIMVAEDDDVDSLKGKFPELELQNVYTVKEAKGREFDFVFCWNITSKHIESWKVILEGKARKNSLYRYYFNQFYVAVTRAKRNLCLYEDINVFADVKEMLGYISEMETFNEDDLGLTGQERSLEAWRKEAEKLEKEYIFDRASEYYRRAKCSHEAERCLARKMFEEGTHKDSIHLLIKLKEYNLAYEYSRKTDETQFFDVRVVCAALVNKETELPAHLRLRSIEILMDYMQKVDFVDDKAFIESIDQSIASSVGNSINLIQHIEQQLNDVRLVMEGFHG